MPECCVRALALLEESAPVYDLSYKKALLSKVITREWAAGLTAKGCLGESPITFDVSRVCSGPTAVQTGF
jgi:hypothetical protein